METTETTRLLTQLAICIERGKADQKSPYPPDMKGEDGASELTRQLLDNGVSATDVLNMGLVMGMNAIGEKFAQGKAFVPQLLISSKAMNAALEHLKPYFLSGEVKRKGKIIVGTVQGDLHDIGKNLVAFILEGGGWEVIDLGTDVSSQKFMAALNEHSDAHIGMSALLTTTMVNMAQMVADIKKEHPTTQILIGGAPITDAFCRQIGADFYASNPQKALDYLNKTAS